MCHRHPILDVVICKPCRALYFKGVWTRDEDGYFQHCRWCANGGELYCCADQECKAAFCSRCLKKNLGRNQFTALQEDDDWRCMVCRPSQIREAKLLYYSLYEYWRRQEAKEEAREARKTAREAGERVSAKGRRIFSSLIKCILSS